MRQWNFWILTFAWVCLPFLLRAQSQPTVLFPGTPSVEGSELSEASSSTFLSVPASPRIAFDSTRNRGFQLLAMTPNPVYQETRLTFQFEIFTRHPLRLQLLDLTGRRLINEHWQFAQDGKYEVSIPLPLLAAGRYLLILDAVGRPLTIPLIVLR